MEQKLHFFRTISKQFIFFWCLLVLLVGAVVNFPTLLQKGPSLLQAEEGDIYIIRSYPECAGEPGMVYDVDAMSDGTYRTYNEHYQAGVCGDTPQTPVPTPTPQPYVVRSYPECAGGPGRVRDVDAMSDGTYRTYNEHYQAGACGDIPSPTPTQALSQPSVIRSYPECAGSPGRVRDVDALSDGTYRTYNERFQSGACGDSSSQVAAAQTQPVTTEEYQCEGGNKVYYRVYINIVRPPEKTGRVDYHSPTCGGNVYNQPRGSTLAANNRNNYPALSASCAASPSQSRVGETVTWQVLTNGGSGSFRYRWSGDESVNSKDDRFIQTNYQSAGVRTAQVEITDKNTDQKTSTSCSVTVSAASNPASTSTQTPVNFYNFNQIATLSTPTPYPTVTPTPIPFVQTQVVNAPIAQCPAGTIEKSRSDTQLICERPSPAVTTITATNTVQCPTGTIEKSRSGGVIQCEQTSQSTTIVLATPTPQPVQTIVTSATTQTSVQCPAGTIEKSRSNTQLICERQTTQAQSQNQSVQVVDQAQVKVLGTETSSIKELPRTGLPLAAVAVSALAPFGWRLRKLWGAKGVEESAQDIWLKRQLQG